jgi:S-methylmethionine-dependent homocysteine/selenocysteine methylase
MHSFIKLASAAGFALVIAGQSFAAQPQINGVVTQTTTAQKTQAISAGADSVAKNRIGAVNANVNGIVSQTTSAYNTFAYSVGRGSTACNEIGVVGESDCRGKDYGTR